MKAIAEIPGVVTGLRQMGNDKLIVLRQDDSPCVVTGFDHLEGVTVKVLNDDG